MTRRRLIVVLAGAAVVLVALAGYWIWWADRDNYLLRADARDLKSTVVTAHLEEPIVPGKNVLWCSTFQLAWNEGCALLGEDIHLDNEPAMVAILNQKSATKADIDEASYVAMAGWTQDGIVEQIRSEVHRKFDMKPELLPEHLSQGLLVEYACLFKNLEFAVPFERIDHTLHFGDKAVRAFGLTDNSTPEQIEQASVLLDPNHDVDGQSIVEIRTKSPEDRLLLAGVKPAATLAATIDKVHALITSPSAPSPGRPYGLVIPKLNFRILRAYDELIGKGLAVANPAAKGMPIVFAAQDIRFQMNERGVVLRSEGGLVKKSAPLQFYHPFLILLERRGAKAPYFALWVDNAELLVPE